MYKKFLAGLLAFALVFGSAAALPVTEKSDGGVISVSAEDEDIFVYGDFQCKKSYDEIEIVKYLAHDVSIVIPDNIDGLPVVGIGESAFADTVVTQEVEFPNTLRYIGERAFSNNWTLREVILPDSVESIGDYAFQYCTALKYLKMPDYGYADIGIFAFRGCSNIKEITWEGLSYYSNDFGDSIEMLMDIDSLPKDCLIRCKYNDCAYRYAKENGYNYEVTNVFNNFACDKYQKYEWNDEKEESIVVDEGYKIYAYLGNEAEITIPSTINNKKVYSVEFYDGSSGGYGTITLNKSLSDKVKAVNISNGVESFSCSGKIESVNVPPSLEKFDCSNTLKKIIYDDGCTKTLNCCHGQTSLETVILPDSLIEISSEEFGDCINLKSLYIPAGVSNDISSSSFVRCLNLENITVDNDNKKYSSENGMIYSKDKSILYYVPNAKESVTVSSKTRIISNGSFNNCAKLKELNLPNNLEKIENGGLLFNIGRNYSLGCDVPLYPPLKSIVIPKSVKYLENSGLGFYMAYPDDIQLPNFKIYCYSNTAGEKYAKDNGFDYELLDKPAVNGTGKVSIENSTSGLKVENISVNIAKSGSGKTDKTIKIGSDGKFTVEGLADGNYDFTFNADKCVPRTYSVKVSGGAFKLDSVELHLYGDVNGDGELTTADVGKANADIRNIQQLTDSYDKKVADVNEDGKITTADVGKTNAHVRGTKNLW